MKTRPFILLLLFLAGVTISYAWRGNSWTLISRESIISNAVKMMDSTWTPAHDIANDGRIFYSGITYTGEPYTSSTPEDWDEFFASVSNTAGGNTYYGGACASFVNISWQLPVLFSIPDIDSNLGGGYFYALGEFGDGPFVALLPGDAFYYSGHVFLFSHYNPDGTVESMEQISPAAERRIWSWSALRACRPIRRNFVQGGFTVNDRVQTSYDVPVRSGPSFSGSPIWTAPMAAQGTIVDGPRTAEKYQWWKVQYDDFGTAGWTTEGYLKKLTAQTLSCGPSSDTRSPNGTITINSGAGYTNGRAVMLSLSCTDSESGCAWMRFSNNSVWSPWEPFTNFKNWVLPPADGSKLVYVQFADACRNPSIPFGTSITLQSTRPDLVISSLTIPGAASAGARINITDTISNIGSGGAAASTTSFFFSRTVTLDSGAILLATRSVPPLPPGTNNTATTSLTIPSGISPGICRIIARANSASNSTDCIYMATCGSIVEVNTQNNLTLANVTIGPDLVISSLSASDITGSTVKITDTTMNSGGDPAGSSRTSFYLSVDYSGNTFLGSRSVPALAAGAISTGTISATIPPGLSPGTYHLIARADDSNAVMEASKNNNTRIMQISVLPDLIVSGLNSFPATSAGASINITETTTNIGPVSASTSTTGFYLSTNSIVDSGDTFLGNRAVPVLAAGASSTATSFVTIPVGTAPGTYYIIVRANNSGAVAEGHYGNNTNYKVIKIQ